MARYDGALRAPEEKDNPMTIAIVLLAYIALHMVAWCFCISAATPTPEER